MRVQIVIRIVDDGVTSILQESSLLFEGSDFDTQLPDEIITGKVDELLGLVDAD